MLTGTNADYMCLAPPTEKPLMKPKTSPYRVTLETRYMKTTVIHVPEDSEDAEDYIKEAISNLFDFESNASDRGDYYETNIVDIS